MLTLLVFGHSEQKEMINKLLTHMALIKRQAIGQISVTTALVDTLSIEESFSLLQAPDTFIIACISADLLASIILTPGLEEVIQNKAGKVIPVPFLPCQWGRDYDIKTESWIYYSVFSRMQSALQTRHFLSEYTPPDGGFSEAVKSIRVTYKNAGFLL